MELDNSTDSLSPEERLHQKHRLERKDLQSEIQRLKHSVAKGDKKKKKESLVVIARLEAELDERQENELAQLKHDREDKSESQIEDQVNSLSLTADDAETENVKKPSKAQRRRDKKEAEERNRQMLIEAQEIANLTGVRNLEIVKVKEKLKKRGLIMNEIPSDGNCLYAAMAHQLSQNDVKLSVSELRQKAAALMRLNSQDFLPFLCHPESGNPFTPGEYEKYCEELEKTAAWGGQLEIQALSRILRRPIEIIQADTNSITQGEEEEGKALTLVYLRHLCSLGEHYNSVQPAPPADNFS